MRSFAPSPSLVALGSALLAAASLASCSAGPGEGLPSAPSARPAASAVAAPGPTPAAALPEPRSAVSPSRLRLVPGAEPTGAWLADVDSCEACHADVAAAFRTSAHAFASFNNPLYRVSVDRFRAEVGLPGSRHCGGCHDVSLLVDGAMDRPIEPTDPRARAGITCRTCHGVTETRADGNGSYTLTGAPIPPPTSDPQSIAAHQQRVAPAPLRTAQLCGACHKAFLDEETGNERFMAGQDDLTAWMRSEYAGSRLHRIDDEVPAADCRACHMPKEEATRGDPAAKEGKVASHRFLGGHTFLSAMRGDAEQLARARAVLEGAVSVDVAAVLHADGSRSLPADGATVTPGERLTFDVVVRNQRVGHRFPGGTVDSHDTWVEVTVSDASGKLLAEAGGEQEASGADPTAHVLRAVLAGADGKPLLEREVNRFRGLVVNHTLAPRDAMVVEASFEAPASLSADRFPLHVVARLRHRSRTLELSRAACAESKTPRGRAFAAQSKAPLDPCVPQPITEIGSSDVWIGPGSEAKQGSAKAPTWRRLYEHALGLSHAVQERLDEARPSLDRALEEVTVVGSPRERAMVHAALAQLEGLEGRTGAALAQLDKAQALLPGHPAIDTLRGEALSLVWRWDEAVAPLDRAARAAPGDDSGWTRLALALGSRGSDREALDATARGLALQPRDQDLLRVQALALRALGSPEAEQGAAAYERHRSADFVPRVRAACSAKVPGCAEERSPVHAHAMRPVDGGLEARGR